MNEYEKKLKFLDYLKKICGIFWSVYDENELLDSFSASHSEVMERLWKETIAHYKQQKEEGVYLYSVLENIYLWVFRINQKYFVFGPIASNELTPAQLNGFLHLYQIDTNKYVISRFSLSQIYDLISFSMFGLTGETIENSFQKKQDKSEKERYESEKTDYDLYRFREEKERKTYEVEVEWTQNIERGIIVTESDRLRQELTSISGIGTMARGSDFKQMEYMQVTGIALATRAAIRGGVPPLVAYETSDIILQKLAKIKNVNEFMQKTADYPRIFTRLVQQYQKIRQEGSTVEICKEYIAKHLYKDFSIQQMANELSMNRSHLSRKFSQKTGESLQHYINSERLNAAANLLKYSEESVSQISEYMHFSSPSRFSVYFKEEYGVSPSRFREENKVIEFKAKNIKQ